MDNIMDRLDDNQIFVEGAKLEVKEVDFKNSVIAEIFRITKQRQLELLDLKEVDPEQLRLIIQL